MNRHLFIDDAGLSTSLANWTLVFLANVDTTHQQPIFIRVSTKDPVEAVNVLGLYDSFYLTPSPDFVTANDLDGIALFYFFA
jgi:hypothetical protein